MTSKLLQACIEVSRDSILKEQALLNYLKTEILNNQSQLKQLITRIDTTLLILLSASIILIEYNERNSTFFLAWVLMLVLFLFFALVLIYSFIRSYKSQIIHPTLLRFLPFVIGLLMIPVFLFTSKYLKNDGFKSVVLKASYEGKNSGINLTLYNDNTFQLLNTGPFGGNYVRGKYKFTQDTLYIEKERITKIYPTGTFVLRMNERKEKYFDPIASDSSMHLTLYVGKDRLTNK